VILELISAMGQSLGYDVQTASSPEVGLKLAEQRHFDVILTDLAMPGLSGLEVASRLRLIRPQVPVILLTGWDVSLSPAQLERSGVTSILRKPFRIEQLADLLHAAATGKAIS
jgi:CheY-like chemotaxis protein